MRSVMLLAVVTILSCTGKDEVKNDDVSDGYIPGADKVIDLSKLVADELTDATFTVTNGMVLTDTLDGRTQKIKIVIADGATVTLADAAINGVHYGGGRDTECLWAGLTCLGDATIILADSTTNTVTNFTRHYPCIHVTEGKTLVIKGDTEGTGKLIAKNSSSGAAIGGGYYINCGNIRIEGGIIHATGVDGAGIGSGEMASCGDITINGGNITATGVYSGAGIGSGLEASCGDITITGGNITTTGAGNAAGIGSGDMANCGNITITGGNITATGGGNGAGIGTGEKASCGDISISGGYILAQGGQRAAGIGCGYSEEGTPSSCGNITLSYSENFVKVTAIKGRYAEYSIGPSYRNNEKNSCGVVIFDNQTVKRAYNNEVSVSDNMNTEFFHFTISTTIPEGETDETPYIDNTWTLEPVDFD